MIYYHYKLGQDFPIRGSAGYNTRQTVLICQTSELTIYCSLFHFTADNIFVYKSQLFVKFYHGNLCCFFSLWLYKNQSFSSTLRFSLYGLFFFIIYIFIMILLELVNWQKNIYFCVLMGKLIKAFRYIGILVQGILNF